MIGFSFQGSSGQRYEYSLLSLDLTVVPRQAGNYILAVSSDAGPKPIFIKNADSVRKSLQEQVTSGAWQIAADVYGVTLLFVHLDPSGNNKSRLQEQIDLIDAYAPPMNR